MRARGWIRKYPKKSFGNLRQFVQSLANTEKLTHGNVVNRLTPFIHVAFDGDATANKPEFSKAKIFYCLDPGLGPRRPDFNSSRLFESTDVEKNSSKRLFIEKSVF